MTEQKNWKETKVKEQVFKKLFINKEYMKDLKTILVFIFAYGIAVVSNGFINEYDFDAFLSLTVGIGTAGLYLAIITITEEGAQRGNQDAKDNDKELRELLQTKREKAQKIDRSIAIDLVAKMNKENLENARARLYEATMAKLQDKRKTLESKKEIYSLITYKKMNIIGKIKRRIKLGKIERQIQKTRFKATRITPANIPVKYEPLEVDDFLVQDQDMKLSLPEKKRLRMTPVRRTRKKMGRINLVKTIFFYGISGAVYGRITSWSGLFWFLILVTITLAGTMVYAYATTRKYAEEDYKVDLQEAINKLQWFINEQAKREKNAT